ncbi:MAG: hypothetical protein CVU14_09650 [Bacteroidetes bacterium HGW-Bacteroidetes-9]|jgi:hypothetical protein|nr:MAG: hypothetical protein CVU14_09650 [Bacteroidetes bacterium HGW-Bacteroidetes-9]
MDTKKNASETADAEYVIKNQENLIENMKYKKRLELQRIVLSRLANSELIAADKQIENSESELIQLLTKKK